AGSGVHVSPSSEDHQLTGDASDAELTRQPRKYSPTALVSTGVTNVSLTNGSTSVHVAPPSVDLQRYRSCASAASKPVASSVVPPSPATASTYAGVSETWRAVQVAPSADDHTVGNVPEALRVAPPMR